MFVLQHVLCPPRRWLLYHLITVHNATSLIEGFILTVQTVVYHWDRTGAQLELKQKPLLTGLPSGLLTLPPSQHSQALPCLGCLLSTLFLSVTPQSRPIWPGPFLNWGSLFLGSCVRLTIKTNQHNSLRIRLMHVLNHGQNITFAFWFVLRVS